MPSFAGASNIAISGGQFSEIHGSVYIGEHPDSKQALAALTKLVQKDAAFNGYNPITDTLKLPSFSKDLLLNIGEVGPDTERIVSGSCCFDLAWRLGLLPGQPNAGFTEYDQEIPLTEVVTRNTCCCGRISRHGFVFLVSRYFQEATTTEILGIGTCIILSTTIGRFKCYEIDDRTFVHFDAATRSSHLSDLVENQSLDHILQVARGNYLFRVGDSATPTWVHRGNDTLPVQATESFFVLPDAVMYMTTEKITQWKKINQFARELMDAVLSFIDAIREPEPFVTALGETRAPGYVGRTFETPAQTLAVCVFICRKLFTQGITTMTYEDFSNFATNCMAGLHLAHQHYRSPLAERGRMLTTSQDRYQRMFRQFQAQSQTTGIETEALIRGELQNLLLSNRNNIALVGFQAFLAVNAIWNSGRILARSREVPGDWIRFVSAEDDYIFLG